MVKNDLDFVFNRLFWWLRKKVCTRGLLGAPQATTRPACDSSLYISPCPCPTPQQIYSMQIHKIAHTPFIKNTLLQKEKNTMQYKRLTASSSLLHNFQPIRKTNKSPTTGGRALAFLRIGFFSFCYQETKLKMVSLNKNKTKMGRKSSQVNGFPALYTFLTVPLLGLYAVDTGAALKDTPSTSHSDSRQGAMF